MSFIQFLLMMSMRHGLCPCEWMIGSKVSWIYNFHFSGCDFHFQAVIFYFQAVMGVFLLELKRGDRVAAEKVNWSFIPSELALFCIFFSILISPLQQKTSDPEASWYFPLLNTFKQMCHYRKIKNRRHKINFNWKVTLFHFSLQRRGQRVGQQERKLQNQDIV